METVQKTEVLPKNSSQLADALEMFALAAIKDHQAGGGGLSADLQAAVAAFIPVIGSFAGIGGEAKVDGVGVVEAFALAGCHVARKSSGALV